MEKDKNKIIEGRWKIQRWNGTGSVILKNIYNGKETQISHRQLQNVLNGTQTISKIQSLRIIRNKKTPNPTKGWVKNSVAYRFNLCYVVKNNKVWRGAN